MKRIHGIAAAKQALTAQRGLDLESVPPHVAKRIEEIFPDLSGLPLMEVVRRVIAQVREGGDGALRDLARRVDNMDLGDTEVPHALIDAAPEQIPADLLDAIQTAAGRIRTYHEATVPESWMDEAKGYGRLATPVESVGCYIPGGTAPYLSTVLMTAIPARVAGVGTVVVCTPAAQGKMPSPAVLAAAKVAGVDRVFRIGGAQAVAALAYGTETVPRVDMVCGPGNIFVTLAKKLLYGTVGIDGLYGPTETLIVADHTANPTLCAADLLAQAEHDAMATPVLITTSEALADAVEKEAKARLSRLSRSQIAAASMDNRGIIAIVDTLEEAMEAANAFAPEHISINTEDPKALVPLVKSAGAVFLGDFSHEVLGDYVAGPSHVMPTGGTARFGSGLGVHSFIKYTPVVALDRKTALSLTKAASALGRAEGFTAHAEAAEVRLELADDK
ncbi:MAG: histidinol dehydrogenase [SAR202 cluster bacterium]|nr:histidinol dehydrogenase [SAR202 cluster bacterium]